MPNVIHETILKDIIDLLDDAKDFADDGSKMIGGKNKRYESLTRAANRLILVFPVLCTKGISIETASMISKAIEKHCVSLLQMLFAAIQVSDTDDLNDYISRFHSNISTGNKITVDDFVGIVDGLKESGNITFTDRDALSKFKQGMSEITNVAKTVMNEYSLQDFTCHRSYTGNYEAILEEKLNVKKIPYIKRAVEEDKNDRTSSKEYDRREQWVNRLSENDIKKANELMPTKVTVNFYSKESGTKIESAIIGVKCKLYTVDSMEIIDRISSKYADTNWVKEIIRASTGEISFWRDFIFAIDRARIDAINSSRKGSSAKMWKVLERRATKNRLQRWKANRADSSPITTLVVSQDEVEYLKKDFDVDLENRRIAMKLMEVYNFMGVTIVDEPAEAVSIIWDEGNEAEYETLSFRNLERESTDKNYKKVINLMTKLSR